MTERNISLNPVSERQPEIAESPNPQPTTEAVHAVLESPEAAKLAAATPAPVASDGGWPIAGSCYPFHPGSRMVARVVAIDGDTVHYVHERIEGGKSYGSHSIPRSNFRRSYCPEDQSPIPALVKALKEAFDYEQKRIGCLHGTSDAELDELNTLVDLTLGWAKVLRAAGSNPALSLVPEVQ